MSTIPKRPNIEDAHTRHHAAMDDRVLRGRGLLVAGVGIKISTQSDGSYKILSTARGGGGSGGGFSLYDKAKSYAAGEMFVVVNSADGTPGFYGVPEVGVDTQLGRTWAGSVPANPAAGSNAVPQNPLPATGTCYAYPIFQNCF